MPDIAIEVSNTEALHQLQNLDPTREFISSERRGMDGVSISTLVMTLSPLIIKGIVDIVKAQIESKKHVRVKINGVEVRGVSEKTLLIALEKSLKEKP